MRRLVLLAIAAIGGATVVPAQAEVGTPSELSQEDPRASGAQTTTPAPPDPDEDIDPVRPREQVDGVDPLAVPVRAIRFPLRTYSSYVDTFGACRDGCSRTHQGIDIFTPKRTHLIAAADGYVTWLRTDASGTAGNGVGITDAQDWRYLYLHANNDTPGTDDGANPARWRFIPGLRLGTKVYAGQILGYSGDSGNAENTPPHLHFEIRHPNQTQINPYPSLQNASWAPPVPRLFRFDQLRGGAASDHLPWATTTTTAILACDIDGDGDDEPVFRDGAVFWASPSGGDTRVTAALQYGTATDRAVCGDWDGNGTDTPGVRRRNVFMLRNSWTGGSAQIVAAFGRTSDHVVIGDWNADGVDTIGVVRSGRWLLTNRNIGGSATTSFTYGRATDRPVPGDWNGDGSDTAGVRRGTDMYLRARTGGGAHSLHFRLGSSGDSTLVSQFSSSTANGDTVSIWRRRPR